MDNNLERGRPVPTSCNCIVDILEQILCLQRKAEIIEEKFIGCEKPFLGPCGSRCCFNTRPVQIIGCCDGDLFSVEVTSGVRTNVFRIERIDGCCCTFRCLVPNNPGCKHPFKRTDVFFTLNFGGACCFGIKCLEDTFIECV